MDDLISRQAAVNLISQHTFYNDYDGIDMCSLVDGLRELPSAQQEIIRCGECKYWQTTWQNDWSPNYHYCPNVDGVRRNDFYCADAERRDDVHTEA